jgi:hypothetical protein
MRHSLTCECRAPLTIRSESISSHFYASLILDRPGESNDRFPHLGGHPGATGRLSSGQFRKIYTYTHSGFSHVILIGPPFDNRVMTPIRELRMLASKGQRRIASRADPCHRLSVSALPEPLFKLYPRPTLADTFLF